MVKEKKSEILAVLFFLVHFYPVYRLFDKVFLSTFSECSDKNLLRTSLSKLQLKRLAKALRNKIGTAQTKQKTLVCTIQCPLTITIMFFMHFIQQKIEQN